MHIMTADDSEP